MDDDARQDADQRFGMPLSMGDDELDEALVVDRSDASVQPDPDAHCPACQCRRMEAVVTRDGGRYDHCEAYNRLSAVRDGRLDLVLDDRLLDRR